MNYDEKALIGAILKYPAEDLPRLVYSDWLIEQGRERHAAFIQQQIAGELAVLPLSVYGHICEELAPGCRAQWSSAAVSTVTIESIGLVMTWRRGFLEEVRCRLEFWTGGRMCHHCNGYGEPDYSERPCRTCRGRGRLIGSGPAMIVTHPISRVSVSDKEPATLVDGVCWREDPSREGMLEVLPRGLLDGWGYTSPGGGYRRKSYRTREAAYDDLSDGLIRWAKGNSSTV